MLYYERAESHAASSDAAAATHLQSASRVSASKVSLISSPTRTWQPRIRSRLPAKGERAHKMRKPNSPKSEQACVSSLTDKCCIAGKETNNLSRSGISGPPFNMVCRVPESFSLRQRNSIRPNDPLDDDGDSASTRAHLQDQTPPLKVSLELALL